MSGEGLEYARRVIGARSANVADEILVTELRLAALREEYDNLGLALDYLYPPKAAS